MAFLIIPFPAGTVNRRRLRCGSVRRWIILRGMKNPGSSTATILHAGAFAPPARPLNEKSSRGPWRRRKFISTALLYHAWPLQSSVCMLLIWVATCGSPAGTRQHQQRGACLPSVLHLRCICAVYGVLCVLHGMGCTRWPRATTRHCAP